jgi:transposase
MERFFEEFEKETDVVMEATFNWPWVADLAEKCGLTPHLGDPMRIKHYRKGLPKSDRKDAIGQGTLWLRGMFPEAYLAPGEVRRRRGLFRMRSLFVRMRTALKNNIHGQLFKLGVNVDETSDAFGDAGRWAMTRLPLDDDSRLELSRKLALLDDLALHIGRLERQIKDEVKESEDAQLLLTRRVFYTETPPPRPGSERAAAKRKTKTIPTTHATKTAAKDAKKRRKTKRRRKSFALTGRRMKRGAEVASSEEPSEEKGQG